MARGSHNITNPSEVKVRLLLFFANNTENQPAQSRQRDKGKRHGHKLPEAVLLLLIASIEAADFAFAKTLA
jgi:hypothetical protein